MNDMLTKQNHLLLYNILIKNSLQNIRKAQTQQTEGFLKRLSCNILYYDCINKMSFIQE